MSELFLLDKSALARIGRSEGARQAFFGLDEIGILATCAIVDLEVGYSARSLADYETTSANRREMYTDLPLGPAVFRRAKQVQQELAARGQHRGPGIPDLVIAACAEIHDAVIIHDDRDFDTIAAVTGQESRWLVPAGSID